jgi:hypothetical protein
MQEAGVFLMADFGDDDRRPNNGDNRDEQYASELQRNLDTISREKCRKVASMRKMVLETIHVLFKEYGINNLYHIKRKVEEGQTEEEMRLAADMLVAISRIHVVD